MLFSENWLREFVNPALSRDELIHQLTMAGLEIEGFELAANVFNDVLVGQIVAKEKHPDADKLSVCQVIVEEEGEPLQIVCGARNARVGIKVPVAMIGAKLAKDFKIKKSKLRGVESNGMLCAEEELGLADASDGLMELADDAPLGMDIRSYLDLDDAIIEVDLTPNRGDCLSIQGMARDLGALNDLTVKELDVTPTKSICDDQISVQVSAPHACPRYVGRVIKGINLDASAPIWMIEKLRRGGIRSIDPVVDVTNYVLLELGQPMHAFDLSHIESGIQVRMANAGEILTLLNGQDISLDEESLVIADAKQVLALAGIMGGASSSVTQTTQDIFLESAFFSQLAIAGKARSYGLHTDSSHRFERGVDYQLQEKAIERATELLLNIVGGEAGPLVQVVSEANLPSLQGLSLRQERLNRMLGVEIDQQQVSSILENLGLSAKFEQGAWYVNVPSHRFDITIEADLIEEVARVYGYNALPVAALDFPQSLASNSELKIAKSKLLQHLANLSYQEVICYSFIDEKSYTLFEPEQQAIALANPISAELAVMRSSLWPGLIKAALLNQNRQQTALRLFEHGLSFNYIKGELKQQKKLAGLLSEKALPISWDGSQRDLDFYDLKADIENLLALDVGTQDYRFEVASHHALHPGQSAQIVKNGQVLGYMGALHPKLAKSMGLSIEVFLFELDLELLMDRSLPKLKAVSKFPSMSRDLALIVDKSLNVQSLIDTIHAEKSEILTNIGIFDIYQDTSIGEDKKSVAINVTFQHNDRTLEELEVTDFVDKIAKKLQQNFNAKLRD